MTVRACVCLSSVVVRFEDKLLLFGFYAQIKAVGKMREKREDIYIFIKFEIGIFEKEMVESKGANTKKCDFETSFLLFYLIRMMVGGSMIL